MSSVECQFVVAGGLEGSLEQSLFLLGVDAVHRKARFHRTRRIAELQPIIACPTPSQTPHTLAKARPLTDTSKRLAGKKLISSARECSLRKL